MRPMRRKRRAPSEITSTLFLYFTLCLSRPLNVLACRDSENYFLENLTNSLSTGTTWQRICDYIELENSQSKTIARSGAGTTDLARFKEVLLRLKREGDAAPGAGGY